MRNGPVSLHSIGNGLIKRKQNNQLQKKKVPEQCLINKIEKTRWNTPFCLAPTFYIDTIISAQQHRLHQQNGISRQENEACEIFNDLQLLQRTQKDDVNEYNSMDLVLF